MSTYDGLPYVPARWFRVGGNLPIVRLVVHDEEHPFDDRSAEAVAHMFATSDRKASAHECGDANSVVVCVRDEDVAYHCPPNPHSWGMERDGYATFTRAQWLSPYGTAAGLRIADRFARKCVKHHVRPARIGVAEIVEQDRLIRAGRVRDIAYEMTGVCGHVDVSNALHQTTHTDPGPGFPWPEFMACVVDAHDRLTEEDDMTEPERQLLYDTAAAVKRIEAAIFTGGGSVPPIGALVARTDARTGRQGEDLGRVKRALSRQFGFDVENI